MCTKESMEDRREDSRRDDTIVVSVVIPAYRSDRTIGQAIRSALEQDIPLEVIVIDDASPESMEGALAEFRQDPRVRILRNEKNSGVAYSRNRGVQEAVGEYVAFLDADDWWRENKLKRQLAALQRTGDVLCCTGRELMNFEGDSLGRVIHVKNRLSYRSLLSHNSINCSSVLVRRDVAMEFPMEYDEAHEDYIMWLKILSKYGKATGIPEPYLCYRMAQNSKSGNKWKSAKMTYLVYRYMGYNHVQSLCFFISYAVHGVWKYWG